MRAERDERGVTLWRRPSAAGEHCKPEVARGSKLAARRCLRCRRGFDPENRFMFMCRGCRGDCAVVI